MAESLGDKIKFLRKDLKMTQTDLAGSEMTKSMLSQIENNIAMPSMKNLQYLASRLSKPVSYFLDSEEEQDILPLEEVQEDMKQAEALKAEGKYREASELLELIGRKYNFVQDSKLYADYLSIFGDSLIELNEVEAGKAKIDEAIRIYESKYMYIDAAKAYLLLCGIPWNKFKYEECLAILEQGIAIYNKSISRDHAFEIELLYNRAIFTASLDRIDESIKATEEALAMSEQTKIYYRTDDLHKNMAVINYFRGQFEGIEKHLEKARQFAEFTDNTTVMSSLEIIRAKIMNDAEKPEAAIGHLNKALTLTNRFAPPLIYTEFAKSYYLLADYKTALEFIKKVRFPEYTPSKYDYTYVWNSRTIEGLSLLKLGRKQEALIAVREGIDKLEAVGASRFLAEAYKALSEIYSENKEYENAFSALKKANEIDGIVTSNGLYY